MEKYYTRACNFYYGKQSKLKVKSNLALPLSGNTNISFDNIEIITRKYKKKIHIKDISHQSNKLKKKIRNDLKLITKRKKFKNLNLNNTPILMGVLNLTPDSFSDGGKRAITNYNTIKVFEHGSLPTFSFIECKLETGRTHQIRVHMSYKGNHILGDKKYKKKFKKLKNIDQDLENTLLSLNRQFLHAKLLGFTHPSTGKLMEFSSKLPRDLENILKKLRKACK